MNNLSWFIYLMQVTDNAASFLWGVFFLGIVLWLVWLLVAACCAADDREKKQLNIWKNSSVRALPVFLAVATLAVILPSRQTMLLIAGSEMGERAMKSDAMKDIVNPGTDLLKAWIKEETERLTNKKKT